MQSLRHLAFISGLLLTAVPATAADLYGRVTFRGAPLAGSVVTANLVNQKGPGAVTVTRTGPNGDYALKGLRNGDYILLVDTNGRRVYQGRITLNTPSVAKNIDLK